MKKTISEPDAAAPAPEALKDTRTARIRTLRSGVKAKGFTFGKGVTVPGVPLAHAEYLKSKGEAEILEVLP